MFGEAGPSSVGPGGAGTGPTVCCYRVYSCVRESWELSPERERERERGLTEPASDVSLAACLRPLSSRWPDVLGTLGLGDK